METGHEIVSTAILFLPLNPVRQLSFVLFVLVNCLGSLSMSGYSVCRLTDGVRHYRNRVYLAVKRQSSIHINDLMGKHRHILDLMAGIILSSLVPFLTAGIQK